MKDYSEEAKELSDYAHAADPEQHKDIEMALRDAYRAGLEEAAKVCDKAAKGYEEDPLCPTMVPGVALECAAAAIRSLAQPASRDEQDMTREEVQAELKEAGIWVEITEILNQCDSEYMSPVLRLMSLDNGTKMIG